MQFLFKVKMNVIEPSTGVSSRLDRPETLAPIERIETSITARTVAYCHTALARSPFFSRLKARRITPAAMRYTFSQYHHWRDRLHQWFGLCIVKAGSSIDVNQNAALLSLSDHIFTDLKDDHNEMFLEFLHDIGLSRSDIDASHRSAATLSYEHSFLEQFGLGTDNFYEALAALSGRELCVSIRNTEILQHYFDPQGLKHPTWLSLHAELEANHFQDSIRPVLLHYGSSDDLAGVIDAIEQGVDRHVQYFEELLQEHDWQQTGSSTNPTG